MIEGFSGRYNFLSNFYPVKIVHQGITYPTVEHYYVALKIKNDQQLDGRYISLIDCRELISKISTPAKVKQFGKSLKLRKDWDQVKMDVMLWGIREKFKDKDLRDLLLLTGDQILVETNWWGDKFWGVSGGQGENNLGKILMKVRDEIRSQLVEDRPSLEDFLFPKDSSK
jgi:ribA/ribD-fused uncharacterized protein